MSVDTKVTWRKGAELPWISFKNRTIKDEAVDSVTIRGGRLHNVSFYKTAFSKWHCQSFEMDQTSFAACTMKNGMFEKCYFSRMNNIDDSTVTDTAFNSCSGTLLFERSHLNRCAFPAGKFQWWRWRGDAATIQDCDFSSLVVDRASFEQRNPFPLFVWGGNRWKGMVVGELQHTNVVTQLAMLYAGIYIKSGLSPVAQSFANICSSQHV